MSSAGQPSSIWLAIAIPTLALLVGCVIATFRSPTASQSSVIRHFTAGVMFAAAGVDVLPELLHRPGLASALRVILGVALGVAAMLAVRVFSGWLTDRLKERFQQQGSAKPKRSPLSNSRSGTGGTSGNDEERQDAEPPFGLIAATAVDVLLDGITLGVVFSLGAQQGISITIALGIEVFFLGVTIGSDLMKAGTSRVRALAYTSIPAAAFAVGAVAGVTLLVGLPSSALEVIIAAGMVALLYLATEELLKEAHETPETTLTTIIFFVGFLVILIYDLLAGGSGG